MYNIAIFLKNRQYFVKYCVLTLRIKISKVRSFIIIDYALHKDNVLIL